ncbi:MAG: hypothetical protein ACP5NV_02960 [Candidatus Woesearchaeota archaeon]
MSDIAISYDLLFDMLRYEKSREELQALEKDFYAKVVDYIKQKDVILLNHNTPPSERELTRIQLTNIRKLLQELYDRREKKIISLALYCVKVGENINTNTLLEEEKIMFDNLVLLFGKYRSTIIDNVLNYKLPFAENMEFSMPKKGNSEINSKINDENPSFFEDPEKIISIRFTKPVPRFLGPELETYGPFDVQDIASVPSKIASILIQKDRAEQIRLN